MNAFVANTTLDAFLELIANLNTMHQSTFEDHKKVYNKNKIIQPIKRLKKYFNIIKFSFHS